MGRTQGFTLVEVVVIVVILGILSVIAITMFGDSNTELQYEAMIQKIASDVRYAQQLAVSDGRGTRVYIDQSNNRYYLTWEDDTYIKNPVGGDDFIVQLGTDEFKDVVITGSAFTNGRLDFNTKGEALDAGTTYLGELTLVELNNAKKLVVTANTGFLKIADL